MEYDAIIVGGGVAGLTAAAFLSKAKKSSVVLEKQDKCGGLVNNFEFDGFTYDGGVRALEDSGVLFPMLRQLGISLDFVPNVISVGIEDKLIKIKSLEDTKSYKKLLSDLYPESHDEIEQIIQQIYIIMHYMDVQYGIDNPLFLDMKQDREYMLRELVPWLFKYAVTAPKIAKLAEPVIDFLKKYTQNESLLDIISQHFFQETPAFFALSYLKLYLDYHYPIGGTGKLISKLLEFIDAHHGEVRTNTQIVEVNTDKQYVSDANGVIYHYRRLIWAADQQTLYRLINLQEINEPKSQFAISARKDLISDKSGNDSIFTLFLGVNVGREYFDSKCTEHTFFTPSRIGQSAAGPLPINQERKNIEAWLKKYFRYTTYEISIPAMRDSNMAPPGKTGLIISVLFDYKLTKQIEEQGWYNSFKVFCEECIIENLDQTLFPGIGTLILHKISSTPLTMARLTNNHEGAITGWSFTNRPVPAESRIPKILNAIKTPLKRVYQAGQWTYSPSGLPISLLTGKIAADKVIKDLRRD